MMTDQKFFYSVICLFLCSVFHGISADGACDKSKCKGPIAYYEDLKCTPIYSTEDNCCAVEYNCHNLDGRSKDKCYFRGHVYELGQPLSDEDARPCDVGCTCAKGSDGFAAFNCAIVDCFQKPPKPGCYRKNSLDSCCPGEEVCPKNPEDRARCAVEGITYLDGEHFTPQSDPNLSCICSEGFTDMFSNTSDQVEAAGSRKCYLSENIPNGEYVLPYCKRPKSPCSSEFRDAGHVHNKCAPVYYSSQNPASSCSVFYRCQNSHDTVVKSENAATAGGSTCSFGQLTMKIGDQLNMATGYTSVCIKCVCDIPPLPTCQRLPDSECDVKEHPPFGDIEGVNNTVT